MLLVPLVLELGAAVELGAELGVAGVLWARIWAGMTQTMLNNINAAP